jgi:hypothetical protein
MRWIFNLWYTIYVMATKNPGQTVEQMTFAQWGNAQIQQDPTMADAMRERRERRARRGRRIAAARQNIEEAKDTIAKADDTLRTSRDADEKTRASDTRNEAIASLHHWTTIYDREEHARSPTQFPMDDVLGTGLGGSSKRRGTKKHQKRRNTRKTRKTRKGKRGRKSKKARRNPKRKSRK